MTCSFVQGIRGAIKNLEQNGYLEAAQNLAAVLIFLPDYPVMAVMEAEARKLHKDFIQMISNTFHVKPFA